MPDSLTEEIADEFPLAIQEIFGSQLCFGFVFGGFGKGYGGPGHDVDMFIVCREVTSATRSAFTRWYLTFHERLGLPADLQYPGEVVLLDDLIARLDYLEQTPIRPVIESLYEYEAILWTDALSEPHLALVEGPAIDPLEADNLMKRAFCLALTWRAEVMRWRPENLAKLVDLDLRRLFRGHITYLKLAMPVPPAPYHSDGR